MYIVTHLTCVTTGWSSGIRFRSQSTLVGVGSNPTFDNSFLLQSFLIISSFVFVCFDFFHFSWEGRGVDDLEPSTKPPSSEIKVKTTM